MGERGDLSASRFAKAPLNATWCTVSQGKMKSEIDLRQAQSR
jgi:hypothetical protein